MNHETRQPQRVGPFNLDDEGLERLPPERFRGARQVDEITVMAARHPNAGPRKSVAKQGHVLGRQEFAFPLVVVLGEDLHAIHLERGRGFDGLGVTAGDRQMRSEQRHRREF